MEGNVPALINFLSMKTMRGLDLLNAVPKTTFERVYYLDLLRIIALAFVMLLHSFSPYITNVEIFGSKTWWFCISLNAIVRTGVPLFFMISGYLLLNDPKTLHIFKFYKKRFIRVLLPFLIWDIIYFVFFRVIHGEQGMGDFLKGLLVNGSHYHFWCVYTLVGIYLIMPFLKIIINTCSEKELLWFLILITFTGTIRPFLNTILPVYIFFFDPLMGGYIGYIILGYILGTLTISRLWRFILYGGGIAGFLLSTIGNHLYSSPSQINLYFNGGYQINHFLIATAIFIFFKHSKIQNEGRNYSLISKISGTAYGAYLMHVLVLESLQGYISFSTPIYNILFHAFATFMICICVMFVISKIQYLNKMLM